jgi:hypothetical protein
MTYKQSAKNYPSSKIERKTQKEGERWRERESERGNNPKKKKNENPKEGNWVPGGGASQPTSHPKRKTKNNWGQERTTERERARERERERALFTNLFI